MANNLTVVGSPTFGAAKFSNGLTAVNHTNYLNGAFNLGVSSTNNWTLEAWVKTNSASVRVFAYIGIDSNTSQNFWAGTAANGNFGFSIAGGSGFADGSIVDSGINISDNAFHHVVLSCSGGTNLKVFVDGVLAANLTGVMPTIPAGFTLGVLNPGNGAFNVFDWPGPIDEVAVWSVQKYTAGFTPPSSAYTGSESNLVSLYHLQADGTDSQSTATVVAADPVIGEYGPTTVAFAWAIASGGTGPYTYQVQRAPDSGGSPGTFANIGSPQSGRTYVDTGRTASTKYWYRVIATDSNSVSGTSNAVSATTLAAGLHYNRLDSTSPATGQAIMLLVPNAAAAAGAYNPATPTPLVMYHHGAGEVQTALLDDSLKAASFLAMIDAGFVLCGSNANGENWGNQASLVAYVDLYNFCNANYNVSHVLFWGQSMGGYSSLLSLSENMIPNVIGWLGTYPACSLASLHGLGTYTAEIDSAFGVTSSPGSVYANKTLGYDPALKWGIAFRGVRMRFYASAGDTVVPKVDNSDALRAIVSGSCAESTVVVCSGNHGDPSHFQPSDYVAFFNRCLANVPPTSGIIGGTGGGRRRIQ